MNTAACSSHAMVLTHAPVALTCAPHACSLRPEFPELTRRAHSVHLLSRFPSQAASLRRLRGGSAAAASRQLCRTTRGSGCVAVACATCVGRRPQMALRPRLRMTCVASCASVVVLLLAARSCHAGAAPASGVEVRAGVLRPKPVLVLARMHACASLRRSGLTRCAAQLPMVVPAGCSEALPIALPACSHA